MNRVTTRVLCLCLFLFAPALLSPEPAVPPPLPAFGEPPESELTISCVTCDETWCICCVACTRYGCIGGCIG